MADSAQRTDVRIGLEATTAGTAWPYNSPRDHVAAGHAGGCIYFVTDLVRKWVGKRYGVDRMIYALSDPGGWLPVTPAARSGSGTLDPDMNPSVKCTAHYMPYRSNEIRR